MAPRVGSGNDRCRDGAIHRGPVVRFNDEGPAGLIKFKPPGNAPKLNARPREELCCLVVHWWHKDPAWWVHQEYRISIDEITLGRVFKTMGYARLSARRPRNIGGRLLSHFEENCRTARGDRSWRPWSEFRTGTAMQLSRIISICGIRS